MVALAWLIRRRARRYSRLVEGRKEDLKYVSEKGRIIRAETWMEIWEIRRESYALG